MKNHWKIILFMLLSSHMKIHAQVACEEIHVPPTELQSDAYVISDCLPNNGTLFHNTYNGNFAHSLYNYTYELTNVTCSLDEETRVHIKHIRYKIPLPQNTSLGDIQQLKIEIQASKLPTHLLPTPATNSIGGEFSTFISAECTNAAISYTATGSSLWEAFANCANLNYNLLTTSSFTTNSSGTTHTLTIPGSEVQTAASGNNYVSLFIYMNSSESAISISSITPTYHVTPSPDADFTASATSVLVGDNVQFTDQSQHCPNSWEWDFPGGTPANFSGQTPTSITYNTPGIYDVSLEITNPIGSDTELKANHIEVVSLLEVNAGTDANICDGQSTTLTGSATGGTPNYTYSWTSPNGFSSNNPTPTVSPSTTTTYTLTVTDQSNIGSSPQQMTDQVTVHVNPTPSANSGSNVIICPGDSYQLQGTTSGGTQPHTYLWTSNSTVSPDDILNPTVTPTTTSTYTLTVTDANGCTSSDAVTITPKKPTVNAGSDVNICENNTTTLGTTASPGTVGPYIYTWTAIAPATLSDLASSNIPNPVFTGNTVGAHTFCLTIEDANGCIGDQDCVTINVDNVYPTADAGIDLAICALDPITIGGSPTGSGGVGGPYTYSWTPSQGLNSSTSANPIATNTTNTSYIVTVTDQNGCSASDDMLLTVHPLPLVDLGGDVTTCIDGPNVELTNANTGVTYQWTYNGGPLPFASLPNHPSITVPSQTMYNGEYCLEVTDVLGCSNTDCSNVIFDPTTPATIITVPPVSTICQNTPSFLVDAIPAGGVFSGPGMTGNSFNPSQANVGQNVISYEVIDANGCPHYTSVTYTVHAIEETQQVTSIGPFLACRDYGCIVLGGDGIDALSHPAIFRPIGGVYSGPGVSYDMKDQVYIFCPDELAPGTYTIDYNVSGDNCVDVSFNVVIDGDEYWNQTTFDNELYDHANDIYTDEENSVYVTGTFYEDTKFFNHGGPSITADNQSSIEGYYVAKYQCNGKIDWVHHDVQGNSSGVAVRVSKKNVYVGINHKADVSFMNGTNLPDQSNLTSHINGSMAIAKLDKYTGDYLSSYNHVNPSNYKLKGIDIYGDNVYVCGDLKGSPFGSSTNRKPFVMRVDMSNNSIVWKAESSTPSQINTANSITYNSDLDLVFITGSMDNLTLLNPNGSTGEVMSTTGEQDAYLAAYTVSGGIIQNGYSMRMGARRFAAGLDIESNGDGQVSVVGEYRGKVDDPFEQITAGSIDDLPNHQGAVQGFVFNWDLLGNSVWSSSIYVPNGEASVRGVDSKDGEVYVVGDYSDGVLYGPPGLSGPAPIIQLPAPQNFSRHMFMLSLNQTTGDGLYINGSKSPMGGTEHLGLSVKAANEIYSCGSYTNTFDYQNSTTPPYSGPLYGTLSSPGTSRPHSYIVRNQFGNGLFKVNNNEQTLQNDAISYNIYPNPSTDIFHIEIPFESGQIQVMDIHGKLLFELALNTSQTTVNLGQHPAGVYFIKITHDNKVINEKLIKK